MKRIGLIIAGMSLSLLLLGAGVWADMGLTDSGSGPGFTYETSPSVHMAYDDSTTTDGYFITSVNAKGTIEYGIVSDYSGYYQHVVGSGNHTAATTAANVTGVDGWTKVGFN